MALTGVAATPAFAQTAAAATGREALNGTWVSRSMALNDGIAAGFPLNLSSTDWRPASDGAPETFKIESLESQKAAVEKVIAANGDVFVYEASRRRNPTYTEAGAKAVADMRAARAAATGPRNPYDQCLPRNAVGLTGNGGTEIFTAPGHVGIISENGGYRAVQTGKIDAASLTPTYNGVSVGHWEGDRLVVVTTNYLGDTAGAWPMSQNAKVTETFWVSNGGQVLNIKAAYEDPEYLKEPMLRMTYLDRSKTAYEFLPTNCVETVQGAAEYAVTFGATPPK